MLASVPAEPLDQRVVEVGERPGHVADQPVGQRRVQRQHRAVKIGAVDPTLDGALGASVAGACPVAVTWAVTWAVAVPDPDLNRAERKRVGSDVSRATVVLEADQIRQRGAVRGVVRGVARADQ